MMYKVSFGYRREAVQNPYIGFTSFQHFRGEPLYSDLVVLPENNMTETEHVECYPIPAYVKQEGCAQGFYPDASVAYIRILWKEFEPEQGCFNFALIEEILNRAKRCGQSLMFRLMPHSTRESDDVPDWLKKLIVCPARPAGMRVKTSPSAPEFLTLFGNAIRVFAQHFDNNPTLAFLDLSLPGAWGEGCSVDLFSKQDLDAYIKIYTDSFHHTMLIGQVGTPDLVCELNRDYRVGWRADCIGHPGIMTGSVTPKEQVMRDVWKTGHVSFESYWWLGEWQRKGWDLDWVIDTTLKWHASTFNGKSLPIPPAWREKVEAWNAKLGYHYTIRSVSYEQTVRSGATLPIVFEVENIGVAPCYHKLPLWFRLKNEQEAIDFETNTDIRAWIEGCYRETYALCLPDKMAKGAYTLQVGIGGGIWPQVCFATDAPQDGLCAVLGTVCVE